MAMAETPSDSSPKAFPKERVLRSEGSMTPVSGASSSSEEDLTLFPLDSYEIIKQTPPFSKSSRYNAKGKDPIAVLQSGVLTDLEVQAKAAAANLSKIMLTLRNDLKGASLTTLKSVLVYEDCVDSVSNSLDECMRTMYALMAKVEELDKKMEPVYGLAKEVENIKASLESFEALCK